MNNREYNIPKNFMRRQEDYIAARTGLLSRWTTQIPLSIMVAMASWMDVPERRINRAQDIALALGAAISSGRPNLVEAPITNA